MLYPVDTLLFASKNPLFRSVVGSGL